MDEARGRLADRARTFYREHEPACTAAFFIAGFLFDALAVGRIDDLRGIVQQAVYLLLCAVFTGYELRERWGDFAPPERFKTLWRYHAAATHFMLGTLLNIYTLFYFKSASFGASFLFLLLLAGLLAINELKPFGGSGTTLRLTLFSLCLISYFTYLVPTAVGAIGFWPFLGSLAASGACVAALAAWLRRRLRDPKVLVARLLAPFACVALGFASLYFLKVIPPVPLSLSDIGVYHEVSREGGHFLLSETRPRWRFWERGDQTFLARPGDKIFCYVAVFSPARFRDRLQLRWLRRDEAAGWQEQDAMTLDATGGREGGWRGFAAKSRWTPGRWRVRVETSDARELGRLDLDVVPDESAAPRTPRVLVR
ncbi:MAG: DUF2914 domain-containing protein [Elusimicrobiota bacterium]